MAFEMELLAALVLFGILMVGMSLGVLLGKKPLKKGCSNVPDDEDCPVCHKKPKDRC